MEEKVVEGKRNGWGEWNKQAGNKKIRWLKNKAIEGNGIPNEAWKYGGKDGEIDVKNKLQKQNTKRVAEGIEHESNSVCIKKWESGITRE